MTRRCVEEECDTILSQYNKGSYCSVHEGNARARVFESGTANSGTSDRRSTKEFRPQEVEPSGEGG